MLDKFKATSLKDKLRERAKEEDKKVEEKLKAKVGKNKKQKDE